MQHARKRVLRRALRTAQETLQFICILRFDRTHGSSLDHHFQLRNAFAPPSRSSLVSHAAINLADSLCHRTY